MKSAVCTYLKNSKLVQLIIEGKYNKVGNVEMMKSTNPTHEQVPVAVSNH
jgi:hypothetical protein